MAVTECPNCSTRMKASSNLSGKQATCPSCKEVFTVRLSRDSDQSVKQVKVKSYIEEKKKDCPFCCEPIAADAKKCRHCGETVDMALRMAEEAKRESERRSKDTNLVVNNNNNNNNGGGGGVERVYYHTAPQFGHWHAIHAFLTLLTCGLWFPLWIVHYMIWSTSNR